jgi:hypothetical protein
MTKNNQKTAKNGRNSQKIAKNDQKNGKKRHKIEFNWQKLPENR